jgi:hypothetical protein
MNKQIRELADEAAKYSAVMALSTGQSGNELFVAKFSELLINQCCKIMIDLEIKYPANLTVREIKKHFGVEE